MPKFLLRCRMAVLKSTGLPRGIQKPTLVTGGHGTLSMLSWLQARMAPPSYAGGVKIMILIKKLEYTILVRCGALSLATHAQ